METKTPRQNGPHTGAKKIKNNFMNFKSQLLCTFSDVRSHTNIIDRIKDSYTVLFNKVYILQNCQNNNELFLTYNIDLSDTRLDHLEKTISVHRKKEFNVLYTINALNELIKKKNGGVLDIKFKIDWSEYSNSLIVTNEVGPRIISTKIFDIVVIN